MRNVRNQEFAMTRSMCVRTALLLGPLVVVFVAGCGGPKRMTFSSPEEATQSLVKAVRADDRPTCRKILGLDSDDTLSTGDPDVDRHNIEEFLAAYDAKHHWITESDGAVTLCVGDSDWPFPFPLIQDSNKWRFDGDRGMDEVIARRIGRNELSAIQSCLAIVDAQREYLALNPEGGPPHYADKFISDKDRKNGLYWPTPEGQPLSPLGELVAHAVEEGYRPDPSRKSDEPRPYHGYLFRLLRGQGRNAPGGARDYVEGGRLTRGFAVVASPAEYEKSGITSFMVSHDGVVYQCDLGDDTAQKAKAMVVFDPGPAWTIAEMRGND